MASTDLAILVADDNEMNRWLLAEQLQCWSQQITQASDGGQAWELLQGGSYQLVFLDVNMPVMTGEQLVLKLRQLEQHRLTRVIAVTAHARQQQRQHLLTQGFDECLIKPIVLADLQRVIGETLDEPGDGDRYVDALLAKFADNRQAGLVLLKRLFAEIPSQCQAIEQALLQRQYRSAWQIAHQVHGAFCYYGFDDLRPLVEDLECSLLAEDTINAAQQLTRLQQRFDQIVGQREDWLDRL